MLTAYGSILKPDSTTALLTDGLKEPPSAIDNTDGLFAPCFSERNSVIKNPEDQSHFFQFNTRLVRLNI
jgi:hypothetical protein